LWWLVAGAGPAVADDAEVTLRVLDDAADVKRVVAAIERDLRVDAASTPVRPEPALDSATAAPTALDPRPRDSGLAATIDREEEAEGEIEDFDVPEDVEIPEREEEDEE
jgi:hypothetical protein